MLTPRSRRWSISRWLTRPLNWRIWLTQRSDESFFHPSHLFSFWFAVRSGESESGVTGRLESSPGRWWSYMHSYFEFVPADGGVGLNQVWSATSTVAIRPHPYGNGICLGCMNQPPLHGWHAAWMGGQELQQQCLIGATQIPRTGRCGIDMDVCARNWKYLEQHNWIKHFKWNIYIYGDLGRRRTSQYTYKEMV